LSMQVTNTWAYASIPALVVRFGRGNTHRTAGTFPAVYSLLFVAPSLRSIDGGSEGVETEAVGVGVGVGVGVDTDERGASAAAGVVDRPHAPVNNTASTATTATPAAFAGPAIS
jgi:hypothetical protein